MKHCFTYCGDERCTCPARDLHGVLTHVRPALPLLETMLSKVGLNRGAEVAREMKEAVDHVLPLQSTTLERGS